MERRIASIAQNESVVVVAGSMAVRTNLASITRPGFAVDVVVVGGGKLETGKVVERVALDARQAGGSIDRKFACHTIVRGILVAILGLYRRGVLVNKELLGPATHTSHAGLVHLG